MVLHDKVLVDAVTKALAEDAMLATVPIKVDFRDGKVRLMSDETDRAQRERAHGGREVRRRRGERRYRMK